MRRAMVLTVAVALAATTMGVASAGGRTTGRKATSPYKFDVTNPGASAWFGEDLGLFFGDGATFPTKKAERSVTIDVKDDLGRPVTAAVWQEGGPTTVICSKSNRIGVRGGKALYVQVFVDLTPANFGGCTTPEVPTEGVVTATFSRK